MPKRNYYPYARPWYLHYPVHRFLLNTWTVDFSGEQLRLGQAIETPDGRRCALRGHIIELGPRLFHGYVCALYQLCNAEAVLPASILCALPEPIAVKVPHAFRFLPRRLQQWLLGRDVLQEDVIAATERQWQYYKRLYRHRDALNRAYIAAGGQPTPFWQDSPHQMPLIPMVGRVCHAGRPLLLVQLLTHSQTPGELFASGIIGWDASGRPALPPFLRTGLIETARWYSVVPAVFAQYGEPPLPLKVEWEDFSPLQAADVQRLGWRREAVIGLDPEPPSDWNAAQARAGARGFLAHLHARLAGRVMPTQGQIVLPPAVAVFDAETPLRAFLEAARLMAKRMPRSHERSTPSRPTIDPR